MNDAMWKMPKLSPDPTPAEVDRLWREHENPLVLAGIVSDLRWQVVVAAILTLLRGLDSEDCVRVLDAVRHFVLLLPTTNEVKTDA
jgi:hypothetical protein